MKGAQGKSTPPISNSMLETAGKEYHLRPRSLNQSYLEIRDEWLNDEEEKEGTTAFLIMSREWRMETGSATSIQQTS